MELSRVLSRARRIRAWLPQPLRVRPWFPTAIDGFFNPAFWLTNASAPPEDVLGIVCRKHYYALNERGCMIGPPIYDKTINYLLKATGARGRAKVSSCEPLPDLNGIEDVRLYIYGQRTYLIGTMPCFCEAKIATPIIGIVNGVNEGVKPSIKTIPVGVETPEKNWVYFENDGRLYLERFPGLTEFYQVDSDTGQLKYHGKRLEPLMWSGTKSVRWMNGNVFLDHMRVHIFSKFKIVLRYVYRFRFHPGGTGSAVLSPVFSVMPESELFVYVSDMAIVGDRLFLGAGVGDRFSEVLVAPIDELSRLLGMG